MMIVETLLTDLPIVRRVTEVYLGENWVVSLVERDDGTVQAGVAAAPHPIAPDARFQMGRYRLDENAGVVAHWLRSPDLTAAAVGLATVNALHQPDERLLRSDDAADWLSAQSAGRAIAIFGRFPFIDAEVRVRARHVWVFEQEPQADELDSSAMQSVLPQADMVAITGSSIINHTLDGILAHAHPGATVVLLGPSTPLSEKLLECGISALFGVRVVDVQQVIESVTAGAGFQKMKGLRRVALFKRPSTHGR